MTTITHRGECPRCHSDISPDDLELPCVMCGAEPLPRPLHPITYTLYGVTPAMIVKGTPVVATLATVHEREAIGRARELGTDLDGWTLVADAGTSRTRFVAGFVRPVENASAKLSSGVAAKLGRPQAMVAPHTDLDSGFQSED